MNRLPFTLLAAALCATVVAAPATAKGPTAATIDGPGLSEEVSLSGSEGSGPLGEVAMSSGFYPQVFRQEPDPTLRNRPEGDLGPRYVVTYAVPGPDKGAGLIRQDLYPYAERGAVSYMKPGQPVFVADETYGGWYVAGAQLKETLVAAGLPQSAPTPGDGSGFPWALVGALLAAAAVVGIGASALVLRRRPHPAM